jgi:hypothetical protein
MASLTVPFPAASTTVQATATPKAGSTATSGSPASAPSGDTTVAAET